MNLRTKNVLSLLFRSSFGLPLGTWIIVSIVYYWWLISRINVLETQNKVFKSQLKLSQNVMRQIESDITYKVPEVRKPILYHIKYSSLNSNISFHFLCHYIFFFPMKRTKS